MQLIGLWVYCLDCASAVFEAVTVCLPFSRGNALGGVLFGSQCEYQRRREHQMKATHKMIFHA